MIDPQGFNEMKLCRTGPMLFNKNDWPIGKSLHEYGEYVWQELQPFQSFVRPGQLIIDIGANIGTHTVWFSQLVGKDGCVLAFEPQRLMFQTLCANVALNHCTNVYTYQKALGKAEGKILVPVRDPYSVNNFGGVELGPGKVESGEPTDIIALDSISFNSLDVIKADIEGMEADFLEGAAKTIAKHRPILYMEADGAQAKAAIRMLIGMGYDCFWHLPPLFNPENFAGNTTNLFLADNGMEIASINMFCVARERNIKVESLKQIRSADENPFVIERERREQQMETALV